MILITGIGNGEPKYSETRHNAGHIGLDALRQALRYEGFTAHTAFKYDKYVQSDISKVKWGRDTVIILQKTMEAMNLSGIPVKSMFDREEIDEFVLFHDDLDIPLGDYKIQKGKSPVCHKGVQSVENELGTKDFWRVRIGIENRENRNIPGEDYVLGKFSKEEMAILGETLIEACEELLFTELFEKWI